MLGQSLHMRKKNDSTPLGLKEAAFYSNNRLNDSLTLKENCTLK